MGEGGREGGTRGLVNAKLQSLAHSLTYFSLYWIEIHAHLHAIAVPKLIYNLQIGQYISFLQGTLGEIVICGCNLLHPQSDLPSNNDPVPMFSTNRFIDVGETGTIRQRSGEIFHWSFHFYQHEAEDSVCIISPLFTTCFGDRVYIQLYINSDGSVYKANTTSIFLVTVGRAKNSPPFHVTTVYQTHNYFSLMLLDSNNAFSLSRQESVTQFVHGRKEFVLTAELACPTTGGVVDLEIQIFI